MARPPGKEVEDSAEKFLRYHNTWWRHLTHPLINAGSGFAYDHLEGKATAGFSTTRVSWITSQLPNRLARFQKPQGWKPYFLACLWMAEAIGHVPGMFFLAFRMLFYGMKTLSLKIEASSMILSWWFMFYSFCLPFWFPLLFYFYPLWRPCWKTYFVSQRPFWRHYGLNQKALVVQAMEWLFITFKLLCNRFFKYSWSKEGFEPAQRLTFEVVNIVAAASKLALCRSCAIIRKLSDYFSFVKPWVQTTWMVWSGNEFIRSLYSSFLKACTLSLECSGLFWVFHSSFQFNAKTIPKDM